MQSLAALVSYHEVIILLFLLLGLPSEKSYIKPDDGKLQQYALMEEQGSSTSSPSMGYPAQMRVARK